MPPQHPDIIPPNRIPDEEKLIRQASEGDQHAFSRLYTFYYPRLFYSNIQCVGRCLLSDMEFSVLDGLYSSINVPDNLDQGYSHFYAEVQRVKKVADEVSKGKNMFVLFDELYKGTNVKDAYYATLACTEAFAKYRNCFFVISTHIIEVGEVLRLKQANIRFAYMPTIMVQQVPKYT